MRAMKDSGFAWVGDVPEGWATNQMRAYFSERKRLNSACLENNLLSLSYGRIVRKDIEANKGLLPASFSGYNIIERDDIVFRLTDLQNDKRSLRTGLSPERGIITSAYTTVHPKPQSNPRYYSYLFRAYDQAKVLYNMGSGVRQSINWSDLKRMPLLAPPAKEQQRIADYLDERCAAIGAQKAVLEKEVDALQRLRKSTIHKAVTKGLNANAVMVDSGLAWIGEIPEHWQVLAFKHVASVHANLADPFKYQELPQISPENIEKDTGRVLFDTIQTVGDAGTISDNHLFHGGQILYSKVRPALNKVVIAPYDGMCSADMYPIGTTEDKRWLVYYMLSDAFLNQVIVSADRVKMPKVNKEELGRFKCILPPIDEQRRIADYLDERCAAIDSVIDTRTRQISRLEDYRKALIFQYVTGKKEVPA